MASRFYRRYKGRHSPFSENASLNQGDAVLVLRNPHHNDRRPTDCSIASLDSYEKEAKRHKPWLPLRFESTVHFVRTQDRTRLLHLEVSRGDVIAHILCIEFLDQVTNRLMPAMAQIEYVHANCN